MRFGSSFCKSRIRHRNKLTEKAREDRAVQGLGTKQEEAMVTTGMNICDDCWPFYGCTWDWVRLGGWLNTLNCPNRSPQDYFWRLNYISLSQFSLSNCTFFGKITWRYIKKGNYGGLLNIPDIYWLYNGSITGAYIWVFTASQKTGHEMFTFLAICSVSTFFP